MPGSPLGVATLSSTGFILTSLFPLGSYIPVGGILMFNLSAATIAAQFDGTGLGNAGGTYDGWAICNGSNATPDLRDRFPRINQAGGGATGGSDSSAHTHAIDHDHASFSSATESAHTHSTPTHSHQTEIGWDTFDNLYMKGGDPASGSITEVAVTAHALAVANEVAQDVRLASTRTDGGGTSGAGSAHSHTVDVPALVSASGAASGTENRPAFFDLVALMRV